MSPQSRLFVFRAVLWAVLGALVGLPLDALHVVTGVLSYRDPVLGLQDWWTIPLFAGAGLALGLTHRHSAVPLCRRPVPKTTAAAAFAGLCALVFCYGSSGLLQRWPVFALVVYVGVFVTGVVFTAKPARPSLILHGVGAGIVGPLVEIAISSTGAFSYTHPDVLGVALWLPGIYLNAGLAAHLMDRHLLARGL